MRPESAHALQGGFNDGAEAGRPGRSVEGRGASACGAAVTSIIPGMHMCTAPLPLPPSHTHPHPCKDNHPCGLHAALHAWPCRAVPGLLERLWQVAAPEKWEQKALFCRQPLPLGSYCHHRQRACMVCGLHMLCGHAAMHVMCVYCRGYRASCLVTDQEAIMDPLFSTVLGGCIR